MKLEDKKTMNMIGTIRDQVSLSDYKQEFVEVRNKGKNIIWTWLNTPKNYENQLWYKGDENQIEHFYKGFFKSIKMYYNGSKAGRGNNFYSAKTKKERALHTGIPSNITAAKVGLILDPAWKIVSKDEKEKKTMENFQLEWEEISEDVNVQKILKKVATFNSINRISFTLPVFNTDQKNMVDWFVPNPLDMIIVKKNNKIIEVRHVEKVLGFKKQTFFVHTVYGLGYISYEVYKDKEAINMVDINNVKGWIGNKTNMYFNGLEKLLMAQVVEYEKDDYSTNIGFFDSMDETISTRIDEARRGKLMRFLPKDLLEINPETGKVKNFKNFGLDFFAIDGNSQEIITSKVDIDQEKYNKSILSDISYVLPNVGLSATTLGRHMGGTDGKDINSDREKMSIKTRNDLIKTVWKSTLHDFIVKTVLFNRMLQAFSGKKGTVIEEDNINEFGALETKKIMKSDLKYPKFDIEFDNYAKPSDEEKRKSNLELFTGGVQSLETTIKNLHPNWSDMQIEEEIKKINEEKGLTPIIDETTLDE